MHRAVATCNRILLSKCVHRWCEHIAEKRVLADKLAIAVRRWTQGAVVSSWNRWVDFLWRRRNMRRAVATCNRILLSKCVHRWSEYVVERVDDRERLGACVERWRRSQVLGGVRVWREWAQARKEQREKMRSAGSRWFRSLESS